MTKMSRFSQKQINDEMNAFFWVSVCIAVFLWVAIEGAVMYTHAALCRARNTTKTNLEIG